MIRFRKAGAAVVRLKVRTKKRRGIKGF
jgi:hypothetical protein